MADYEPVQTILLIFAAVVYGAIATGCVIRTLFEGYATRASWDIWRVCGLILCFAWPILIVASLAPSAFRRRPLRETPRPSRLPRTDIRRADCERVPNNG
ncbi:hypothetical protein [Rhizobium sp. G21]|uniref:hypothetical protein n=1 Tax=Rhizobium sp. G21 TaxID=2758439 RepID=UPI0016007AF5|nr:hypothetical protein [Rhizobium sp. G21]MBB1248432.1 hypothetical protein [Rhizobium sp. G21]